MILTSVSLHWRFVLNHFISLVECCCLSTFLCIGDVGFQAVHPRERNTMLQKWGHTQIAVGTRMASYHDEVKISLPALLTPQHHLVFTFFHVDLQMKLEAPKPVCLLFLIHMDCA
jgi:hypothetical protein